MPDTRDWREIATEAQEYRESTLAALEPALPSLPPTLPLNVTHLPAEVLSPAEIEITSTPPEKLVKHLASGAYTSKVVVAAYLRRAALAQQLVNCLTELLPSRALKRAEELDHHLQKHGKPIGPLHGLPISVKEHLDMEGLSFNGGFCSAWTLKPQDANAHILQILWDAGCAFYCRTTEPQTIMHLETSSNLYGVTVNPYHSALTAGGSSGGEGALIGLGGSCLGIGSDIGGSVRSPAANNGCYALRPTTYRVPHNGASPSLEGMEHVVGVIGPMSSSLEGIKICMKVIIDAQPWLTEPSLIPLPWRMSEKLIPGKLKVAVIWDDGIVKPHPPINRVLRETVHRLKAADDVEVVEWKPYKHDYAWELIASLYFPDGGQFEKDAIALTGEPWLPLSRWIVTDNPYVRRLSPEDIWSLTDQRERYRTEYARLWNETATGTDEHGKATGMVDVILCPVGPGAAPPLDCSKYWGYTSQWNLLDYPALVFPVGQVDQSLDGKDKSYVPMNEQDKFNHELYWPERYRDAPLGLQLVGRRYEDERVIQAMEIIQRHLKRYRSMTGPL